MKKSYFFIAVLFSLALAAPAFADIPPPPQKSGDWKKEQGQELTLEGVAKNAKLGAMILVDREPIYIADMDSWAPELLDKKVRVHGRLKTFTPPVAKQDKDGAWSQGVEEPVELYRMEDAKILTER